LQRFEQFGLVYCRQCGAIFGVVPLPPKIETPPTRLAGEIQPQSEAEIEPISKPQSVLEVIGNADLSGKIPYDPVIIANRMKAATKGQGSRYLQVAVDDGPPFCPQHKTEMARVTIPPGYTNAGREVWLCAQFNSCRQWELAK
jgi:hypothetical protein